MNYGSILNISGKKATQFKKPLRLVNFLLYIPCIVLNYVARIIAQFRITLQCTLVFGAFFKFFLAVMDMVIVTLEP